MWKQCSLSNRRAANVRPEGIYEFTKIHVYARIDADVYATIYAESPDGNNLSNRRRATLVRKGMVQRSSETAVQIVPAHAPSRKKSSG